MSRTLSTPTSTATTAPVRQPSFFVELGFSPIWRACSRKSETWNSIPFPRYDFQLSGFAFDGSNPSQEGTIVIANADLVIGTLVLGQDISEKSFKIWKYYGESPAVDDPVLIFSGFCDGAEVPGVGRVKIDGVTGNARTLYCPRVFMTPENGFNFCHTPGQQLTWNGETFIFREEDV